MPSGGKGGGGGNSCVCHWQHGSFEMNCGRNEARSVDSLTRGTVVLLVAWAGGLHLCLLVPAVHLKECQPSDAPCCVVLPAGPHDDTPELVNTELLRWVQKL